MNKRKISPELSSDVIAALPPGLRKMGEALNHKLRTVAELQEAGAGLRGTVELATQKKKEPRGTIIPGLHMGGNRAAALADPVDDQDIVTLGFLKKYLSCERLTDLLDDCPNFLDALDDELDVVSAAGGQFTHFWGYSIHAGEGALSRTSIANEAWAWRFLLPFNITVGKLLLNVLGTGAGLASIGLYDLAGNLLIDSGTFSVSTVGVKSKTLASSVRLTQGEYYLAMTANIAFTYRAHNVTASIFWLPNKNLTREGRGTATAGGVLNSTLGALAAFAKAAQEVPPAVFFET